MNIDEGEELIAGGATVRIPKVGIYKLLAKKKVDGTIEWAHFVERDSGLKEHVLRGAVKDVDELAVVIEVMSSKLLSIFGVTLVPAEYEVLTRDGQKVPDTVH